MAHQIAVNKLGQAQIAYAGDTPWHGLGTKMDGLQTVPDMLKAAHLDWTVGLEDLFLADGTRVDSHRALIRQDDRAQLSVVTKKYFPIQNAQCGELADALVLEGDAQVEVAGALGRGERCWMLTKLPNSFEVVSGDRVDTYFLLAWGHDGKHGVGGKLTGIRVVCANTLNAAGFGNGKKWSESADVFIRHSAKAAVRIDEARKALGIVKKQVEETADAYRVLAGTPLVDPKPYFADVFPEPERVEDNDLYELRLARWNARQQELLQLFEAGRGTDIPGVRGSAWGGYNAVTEWFDHVYPVLQSGEVSALRQESVLFGAYGRTKARAMELALELAD